MIKPMPVIFYVAILYQGCSRDPYTPDHYLSKPEQSGIIEKTIRYSTKLPPNASQKTKFDTRFDDYYERAANEYALLYYYKSDTNDFFFMTRLARSITPMKEGIGGMIKINDMDSLEEYNELFRTWKMPEDTLKKRGRFLFDRMVKGKDMTMYYTKFQRDKYIEFPDERFKFDKERRIWIDKVLDSLIIR